MWNWPEWGAPDSFNFAARDHMELATLHKMVELEGARLIAGSRAYALKGTGALLELAVLRFALDTVVARGLTPVLPPLMVRDNAMYATGYFPLGEESAYELGRDKLYLTGTSEVGMVAMHMGQTLDINELPIRYAGMTPCFRREAGIGWARCKRSLPGAPVSKGRANCYLRQRRSNFAGRAPGSA